MPALRSQDTKPEYRPMVDHWMEGASLEGELWLTGSADSTVGSSRGLNL